MTILEERCILISNPRVEKEVLNSMPCMAQNHHLEHPFAYALHQAAWKTKVSKKSQLVGFLR